MSKRGLGHLSSLPEHIIHHINSFLPAKDAVRTRVLSKMWKCVGDSYPILHFDITMFALRLKRRPESVETLEQFMDFVDHELELTMQKRLPIPIVQFFLNAVLIDSKNFCRIDRWFEMLQRAHCIEELCLVVKTSCNFDHPYIRPDYPHYELPLQLLAALKCLRFLYIGGCKFPSSTSFVGGGIRFLSLKHLRLGDVHFFDENALDNLVHCCPWLQVLSFFSCTFYFKTLELSRFPELREASIKVCDGFLGYVGVSSPSLQEFEFVCFDDEVICHFSPPACLSLRKLTLSSCKVDQPILLEDLTRSFPLLEEADIDVGPSKADWPVLPRDELGEYADDEDAEHVPEEAYGISRLRVSANYKMRMLSVVTIGLLPVNEVYMDCPNLRSFSFEGSGLREVYIDCPNLREFKYVGNTVPTLVLFNSSVGMDTLECSVSPDYGVDTSWFVQLRTFLQLLGRNKILLDVTFCSIKAEFSVEGLAAFQGLLQCDVDLTVDIYWSRTQNQAALVDGLLWATRPATLIILGYHYGFVKYLCQELLFNKIQDTPCWKFCALCWSHYCYLCWRNLCRKLLFTKSCCELSCSKHWWHHIKSFQFESDVGNEDMKGDLHALVNQHEKLFLEGKLDKPKTCFKFHWFQVYDEYEEPRDIFSLVDYLPVSVRFSLCFTTTKALMLLLLCSFNYVMWRLTRCT